MMCLYFVLDGWVSCSILLVYREESLTEPQRRCHSHIPRLPLSGEPFPFPESNPHLGSERLEDIFVNGDFMGFYQQRWQLRDPTNATDRCNQNELEI